MGDAELYAVAEKYFKENHEGTFISLKVHKNEVFFVYISLSGKTREVRWENPPTTDPFLR
jgi:hypothetical protein